MLTWTDYQRWLGPLAVGAPPAVQAPELAELATDSRTLAKGQWFVPITGDSYDGHKFIEAAVRQGAGGFFYDVKRRSELPETLLPLGLGVTDTLAAFQQAASGWRKSLKNLRVAALTGSAGKTTTKEMLGAIFRQAGPTLATQASFNNEVGVPKTLQGLTAEHRYAALEFGARMPGNIRFLCELGAPDVAGVINVGTAHLGIFGSVENLLNTKLEIFRDVPAHATLVANADDPRILSGAKSAGKGRVLTFGQAAGSDVQLVGSEWHTGDGTMAVTLRILGKTVVVPFGVAHEVFPINAAAACALAVASGGVTAEHCVAGLSGFAGMKGRYQVHRLGRLTVIDDTYNANPDSMRAGLATLTRAFAGHHKVLVLGDMLELGEGSAEEHRQVGETLVAPVKPQLLVTVGKEARHIAAGAVARGYPEAQVRSFDSIDSLLADAPRFDDFGDVLYAKGSNGIRLGKLVDQLLARTVR